MTERNPLVQKYGALQGRLAPANFTPTDGEYSYVLGTDGTEAHYVLFDDYVEVSQALDLTSIDVLRIDSKLVQPATMPADRVISGSPETATLQRSEVLTHLNLKTNTYATAINPGVETVLKEPFNLLASSVLSISIDGGAAQNITFPAAPPIVELTAAQVVSTINATLTGGTAQVGWDADDPTVIITNDSTGYASTIEIVPYGGGDDANDRLQFNQKTAEEIVTDTAIHGGDDLSAIVAPDANFTSADEGMALTISGATDDADNNITTHITRVVDAQTALLYHPITDESTGFTATIEGCLWTVSLWVDNIEVFNRAIPAGDTVLTRDIAANVSKLSGSYEVRFRLQLKAV